MKLIVGLGNPGEQYRNNRHNVGFILLDKLRSNLDGKDSFVLEKKFKALVCRLGELILVKPETFMNDSGEAVSKVASFYKIDPADLWLIHDDLDIRLGEYKIHLGKGPKVHNGVNSVEQVLGIKDFWRVRIGVDNRQQGQKRTPGDAYVLDNFTKDEMLIVGETIEKIIKELEPLFK